MTRSAVRSSLAALVALALASNARAQVLTADSAVVIALKQNPQVIFAKASVLDAKAGLYGAYSGILPTITGSWSRSGQQTDNSTGSQVFGSVVFPTRPFDSEGYATSPVLSGSWNILDLQNLTAWRAAKSSMKAAKLGEKSTRQQAAFDVRRQFYVVVQQIRLALVADASVKLARDDERRVRALFEVGSVSRNDLLRAKVRTSQAQLDSLTNHQQVTVQRNLLASFLGISEATMGEVDTSLVVETTTYEEPAVLSEATRSRPDLLSADAELHAAETGLRAANFARLPYVTVGGSATFNQRQTSKVLDHDSTGAVLPAINSNSAVDRILSGRVALNLDIFTGFATESRIASSRARVVRAKENRDALYRNLAAEVHEALISYEAAAELYVVSQDALESALENLRLVQQKYNVGSATILDLIDAQVSATRAASDRVRAMASIRVADAQVTRVRGLGD
jgi:outer membrane protein